MDLTPVYAALQKADAAGDTAGAKQLADYIRSQSALGGTQTAVKSSNPLANYDPTQDMSALQRGFAGAGKATVDLGHGLRQLAAEAGNKVGLVSDQTVQDLRSQEDDRKQLDASLMNTTAGKVGYLGGALATTAVPAGMVARGAQALNLTRTAAVANTLANPTTYRGAIAAGAALGAANPVGTDDSRALNTVVGGIAGGVGNGVVNAVGAVARPVANQLSQAGQKAVQVLRNAGVPLDAAQQTGSRALSTVKRFFNDNPVTAAAQQETQAQQRKAFTSAVLKTVGETGDTAAPEVLDRASSRIGQVFDDVAARNPIPVTQTLTRKLDAFLTDSGRVLKPDQISTLKNNIDFLLNHNGGVVGWKIPGEAYQTVKTALDKLSMGQDQAVGQSARDLRELLDGELEQATKANGNGSDYADLLKARQQWRRLKQILPSVDTEGVVNPSRLWQTINTVKNAGQAKMGRGDQQLASLARAGKTVLVDGTPNSGTALRGGALALGAGAVGAVGTGLSTGDWSKAAEVGGGLIAAPYAARSLLSRPGVQNYLVNGLAPPAIANSLTRLGQSGLFQTVARRTPNAFLSEVSQRNPAPAGF